MSRLFVSAAHRSSGKTTFSIGLAAALRARGTEVQCFKKGPDYIDPLWLSRASGRPVFNLDYNTQAADEIRGMFTARQSRHGINIIEGNMGLHDGVDVMGSDSSAALARLLKAPVVLTIDVSGMTRGVAALLLGAKLFDPEVEIGGVVLNQVGTARQEAKLRAAIEQYTGLPVRGALPRTVGVQVKERHLGLTTPGDEHGADHRIALMRQLVEENCDLDALVALAGTALPLPATRLPSLPHEVPDVTIGIAMDEAFCFYYPEDIEALEAAGARLVFFSPIHDKRLPRMDGLFLGGGFPETHMAALEANTAIRYAIMRAALRGLPIHAECGGLMYLTRSITYEGQKAEMAGVIPADAVMHGKAQGRGLVVLEENRSGPVPTFPAHEFHHASLDNIGAGVRYAWRVRRGHGIDGKHDGIVVANTVASFSHFRDTSLNHWTRDFVDRVRDHARNPKPALSAVN